MTNEWKDDDYEWVGSDDEYNTREAGASWRTSDYALVGYLTLSNIYYDRMDHTGPSVYWYYDVTDELNDCIGQFTSGRARVEPSKYSLAIRQTMRELDNYRRAHMKGSRR